MKFRVSPKDLVIFIVFCIFLLFLCAVAVTNFASFAQNGTFAGLNPFPAFGGKFIGPTFLLFAIAIGVIFTSVSSYIFEKDKGNSNGKKFFNLIVGDKEEKGYNRWAKDKEIKDDKGMAKVSPISATVEAAGIPLINNGKEIYVDNGEYHNMVIGSTGSGKTETIVKPMVNLLAKHGESMIITDPKGEIYRYSKSMLEERGYKIIVLNFRDNLRGNSWNPLTLPYQLYKEGNKDKAIELIEDVSHNIMADEKAQDPFWGLTSADYFAGLTLGLFEDAKDESEVNINSVSNMSTIGEDRLGPKTYIQEYFNLKGTTTNAYTFASGTINAPNETKGSILSTFRQKIRVFATKDNLSEMLSHTDFNMRDIGKGKTAIFIVIQDEKTTYHGLATIFLKQCYESLIDVAQSNGGKLPYRTNFILDEFANMPPLKDVDAMVTAARSRDIRFTFIIQNYAQLDDVYGKEVAQTIRGNCGNLVYLISSELAALEEISKMCGEVKSKKDDKTDSRPLVTISDLQKMKLFEAIIIRLRMPPFKTKLKPDFEMDWGIKRTVGDYPTRKATSINIFDVKDYVKEEKRKKMMESFEGNERDGLSANPFTGSNPFAGPNPFANSNSNQSSSNPFMGLGGLSSLSQEDIEETMRNIDKRMAELDEEERLEKEKAAKEKAAKEESVKDITTSSKEEIPKIEIELPKEETTKETIEMPNLNIFQTNDVDNTLNNKNIKEEDQPEIKEPNVSLETEPENSIPNIKIPKIDLDIPYKESTSSDYNIYNHEVNEVKEKEEPKLIIKKPTEENVDLPDKPVVNVDADSVIIDDNVITDDQFFDDFFGDD